jgi:exonuclease SbcD
MIKFLHTADLHLGKVFHEHSLLEDQRYVLGQLGDILSGGDYGALIIAGDIYDRSIPAPEAAAFFGSFLGNLKKQRPSLEIFILPGNHDSPSRLGYGQELFDGLGIHIVTDPEKSAEPLIVTQGGERCAFFLLPFLTPGSLAPRAGDETAPEGGAGIDDGPIRSQARLAREAAVRLEAAQRRAREAGADYTVLGAHLFTTGGLESESERNFLGSAEQVDAGLFSGFDYLALGHLHRFQRAGSNAWYAGSPLAYSFDEEDQEKVFLSVELEGETSPGLFAGETAPGAVPAGIPPGGPRVNPIPVKPLRRLRRFRGTFDSFFRDSEKNPLLSAAEGDYLEISLTDPGLVENPLALLRQRFPWLLSIKQDEAFAALVSGERRSPRSGNHRRSAAEDFADFLVDIYGEADPGKIDLFQELLGELSLAADQGSYET